MRVDNRKPLEITDAPITVVAPLSSKKVKIIDILDSSGSMSGTKYFAAVAGIKTKLEGLAQDNSVTYDYTLYEFSSPGMGKYQYRDTDVLNALIATNNLRCFGSGTALTDAIVDVLTDAKRYLDPDTKLLINIFTDGQEAHSRRNVTAGRNIIQELIGLKAVITFVATKYDVQTAIRNYGIDESNTLVHENTAESIKMSAEITRSATLSYSKSVALGQDTVSNFYSNTK